MVFFSTCFLSPSSSSFVSILTPPQAPEILNYQPYDAKADLWSVGVILFEMLTGKYPFPATDRRTLVLAISNRRPQPPRHLHLSRECWDLIDGLLQVNPALRPSHEELLHHPFFAEAAPVGQQQRRGATPPPPPPPSSGSEEQQYGGVASDVETSRGEDVFSSAQEGLAGSLAVPGASGIMSSSGGEASASPLQQQQQQQQYERDKATERDAHELNRAGPSRQ